MLRVLIVDGSPEPSSSDLVSSLAEDADYIIAVDHGAAACRDAGVRPDLFVGDKDSVDPRSLLWIVKCGSRLVELDVEKDATDLGVALECAKEAAERRNETYDVTLTCASGGRPDHALGVIGLLAQYKEAFPFLIEDSYELGILSPEGIDSWEFDEDEVGKTFSAIALEPGTVISEWGMRWTLEEHELPLLGDQGVSNRIVAADAKVTCHEGCLAAFLLKDLG